MRPVSEMCARTRRGSAVLLLLLMLIAAAIVTQCISSNTIVATLVLLLPVRSPIRSPVGGARRRQDGAVGVNLGSFFPIINTQLRRDTQAQA